MSDLEAIDPLFFFKNTPYSLSVLPLSTERFLLLMIGREKLQKTGG